MNDSNLRVGRSQRPFTRMFTTDVANGLSLWLNCAMLARVWSGT